MFRLASLLIICQIDYASLAPTENYPFSESLASKYMLYWKYNDTHITFETHVNALGYTGFGISKSGTMFPGDVVMGYVSQNKAHLKDCYTSTYAAPSIDTSQDWALLSGESSQGNTVLKFTRALNTHDDNDIPIQAGVTHVIWAFTENQPQNLDYHFMNRGSKDITLLAKNQVAVGK